MKSYRRWWFASRRTYRGAFETSGLDALEDICVARAMFGIARRLSVRVASVRFERRMLESGPDGMRRNPDAREVLSPGDLAVANPWIGAEMFAAAGLISGVAPSGSAPPSPRMAAQNCLIRPTGKKMAPKAPFFLRQGTS